MSTNQISPKAAAAFVLAQQAFGPALKQATNPAFRSKYADLSACVEAVIDGLHSAGLALMQITHDVESGVCVETLLIHESGEVISGGRLRVPAQKQDAQGYGSALTYARRYSLMSTCGHAPEDDDGNAASKGRKPAPVAPMSIPGNVACKDAAASLDADTLDMLARAAETIEREAIESAADAVHTFDGATGDDAEQKKALWGMLSSGARSKIKAIKSGVSK